MNIMMRCYSLEQSANEETPCIVKRDEEPIVDRERWKGQRRCQNVLVHGGSVPRCAEVGHRRSFSAHKHHHAISFHRHVIMRQLTLQ
jgi:hypothetical protein